MAELISDIFGEGRTVEWFDYDEPPYTPYTFDIITNATMTEDIIDRFLAIIDRVKNERSWLRRVVVERKIGGSEHAAVGAISTPTQAITNNSPERQADVTGALKVAVGAISSICYRLAVNTQKTQDLHAAEHSGSAITTDRSIVITNHPSAERQTATRQQAGIGAAFYPSLSI